MNLYVYTACYQGEERLNFVCIYISCFGVGSDRLWSNEEGIMFARFTLAMEKYVPYDAMLQLEALGRSCSGYSSLSDPGALKLFV